jgi:putative sigma-54 modulation protein
MRLQVKGKNLDVSDSLRSYAEQKLRKLDRLVPDLAQIELELCVEKNPSIADNQVAEATIWAKGQTLRGRTATRDMKASIDGLVDNLERQVKRYKEKRRRQRSEEHPLAKAPAAQEPLE